MLKLTIAALAAMLLTACGSPEKRTEKQQEKTILCGGYTGQRPLEASDRELFRRATTGMTGVSYTPESVATQVVAGTNYRFICTAKTTTPGLETYEAEIIVFQPLPGQGEAKIARSRGCSPSGSSLQILLQDERMVLRRIFRGVE